MAIALAEMITEIRVIRKVSLKNWIINCWRVRHRFTNAYLFGPLLPIVRWSTFIKLIQPSNNRNRAIADLAHHKVVSIGTPAINKFRGWY